MNNNFEKICIFLVALICLGYQTNTVFGKDNMIESPVINPFHEITLDQEGIYNIDVDFDGVNERIDVDENSIIMVNKINEYGAYTDVSNEIPYSMIRIHRCCPAHRAYTTINYLQQTIYTEAHYGFCEAKISQYKKVGNNWISVLPIIPLTTVYKDMFPKNHTIKMYFGSLCYWSWANGKGGFYYRI